MNRLRIRKVSRLYASKSSAVQPGTQHMTAGGIGSRNTRVSVCVCKQLLLSELFIHTTRVKLSYDNNACAAEQDNTTSFDPRYPFIETIGEVNIVWQHLH